MSGYSVDQLLTWSLDQQLIERYFVDKVGVYHILEGGNEHVLERDGAERLLVDLLRRVNAQTGEDSDV